MVANAFLGKDLPLLLPRNGRNPFAIYPRHSHMPARSWIVCTTLKVAASNISFVINVCLHKKSSVRHSKNLHSLHNQQVEPTPKTVWLIRTVGTLRERKKRDDIWRSNTKWRSQAVHMTRARPLAMLKVKSTVGNSPRLGRFGNSLVVFFSIVGLTRPEPRTKLS